MVNKNIVNKAKYVLDSSKYIVEYNKKKTLNKKVNIKCSKHG